MADQKEGKRESFGVVRTIILIVAIGVFCFSAYQLYKIYGGYKAANDEYDAIEQSFTKEYDANEPTPTPSADAEVDDTVIEEEPEEDTPAKEGDKEGKDNKADQEEEEMLVEDAEPPMNVDWAELKKVNPDITGWVYVEGMDNISYPICLGEDNDYYLHHTFRKESVFAGAIFEDYHNSSDFADPNTIVYGHNMRNGSMFGKLKFMRDQAKYDENPFFWILTPDGNYRYHIFAIFLTPVDSEVYTLFSQNSNEFLRWERRIQAQSEVKNSVPLSRNDKTVVLSTCTSDSSKRCVVIGKCVSSKRPVRKANARRYQPAPLVTKAPGNPAIPDILERDQQPGTSGLREGDEIPEGEDMAEGVVLPDGTEREYGEEIQD